MAVVQYRNANNNEWYTDTHVYHLTGNTLSVYAIDPYATRPRRGEFIAAHPVTDRADAETLIARLDAAA